MLSDVIKLFEDYMSKHGISAEKLNQQIVDQVDDYIENKKDHLVY